MRVLMITLMFLWQTIPTLAQQETFTPPFDGSGWYTAGYTIGGTVWGLIMMIIFFLLFTLPFRLIIYYTSNYKLAINCRKISQWILMIATIWAAFYLVNLFSFLLNSESYFSGELDLYRQRFLPVCFTLMFLLPLYYLLSGALGKFDFYRSNHVPYLKYYILYLRSFKDDRRRNKSQMRLMSALKKIYTPYAIGQPNEFMPPRGAKRIYAGNDWQEVVMKLQQQAPLILQRINISEGYLWEFEQCVEHGYLNKVIFWVTDFKQYESFRKLAKEDYLLDFPELHQKGDEEQVFYLREDGTYRIIALTNLQSYDELIALHRQDHPEHLRQNLSYFWKRDSHLLKEAFAWHYDSQVMPGIDRLSWVGLLFPKYYLICHRIRWRVPLYLLFACIQAAEALYPMSFASLTVLRIITNVMLAYVFCRNGRRLVWLSERWESKEYYEKVYRRNTWLAVIFGILFNALWIIGTLRGITFPTSS